MARRDVILQVLVSPEERTRITQASDEARRQIGTASLSAYCREAILRRVADDEQTFSKNTKKSKEQ